MAQIVVRQLPEAVHVALRVRAKRRGMSAEALVREILAAELLPDDRLQAPGLGDRLAAIWDGADLDGVTFERDQGQTGTASQRGHDPLSFE